MAGEKTALVIFRDHLWAWIEEEEGFGYKNPLPGNPFALVDECGPARIAEWLISRRFYFWSLDIPDSLFAGHVTSQQRVELSNRLRGLMRCYSYKTNLQLKNRDQEYIRDHFRRDWMFPSSSGGSQGHDKQDTPDVREGLAIFYEECAAFLDADQFKRFSGAIEGEIALYRRIAGYSDDAAYKAYYKLLCAFIAYGTGQGMPDTLELSTVDFWNDSRRVSGLVADMGLWFSEDALMGQHAKRFEKVTLEELESYRLSSINFDLSDGGETADFQRTLMSVCTVPQLFDAASGNSPILRGFDEHQIREIEKSLNEPRRVELFKSWVLTAKDEWLPEFVTHKANVVWNVMVGSTVGPAQALPNAQEGKTVVASIVVQGSRLESAIVAGCPPVDVFNISAGVERCGVVASFDLGSKASPRDNGILFVIGRSNGTIDSDAAKEVKRRLQDCARGLFDRWMGDGSKLIALMEKEMKERPIWFRCGASYRVFDLTATDALAKSLANAVNAFETWSHPVGGRVFSGKGMKKSLNEIVDDFFDVERLYLKSELPDIEKKPRGESTSRFSEIPAGGKGGVVPKALYGKAAVKENVVDGCVEAYILGFYNQLVQEWSKCAEKSCEELALPIAFAKFLVDEIKLQIAPDGHSAPRMVDEGRLLPLALDSIVDTARKKYKEVFLSVGREKELDLSVSREQLVMRVDDGRAVLESVTENSPSFVKREAAGGSSYFIMGAEEQQARMIDMLEKAGVKESGGVVVIRLKKGASVELQRGDVVHLGERTELELH